MKTVVFFAALLFSSLPQASLKKPEAIPGEYVVRIKDSYSVLSKKKNLEYALGGTIKKTIVDENIVVLVRPSFELEESALQLLQQSPLVAIAEPNFIYHANKVPNDPLFVELWGMENFGQVDSRNQKGIVGVDISAEKAWDIETGSQDVVVAVIDSGIDLENPDLIGNLWMNKAEVDGQAGVDDDNNGYVDDIYGYNFLKDNNDPRDDFNHGTHCAGVIGARGNNQLGVVGVAWNTRLMALKILDDQGSGSLASAIEAVSYATKMGAKIISNSWGGSGASENLRIAIEKSNSAGALFVAAAGNDSANNDAIETYPASYEVPNVIAVAAVDNRGELAYFSNYGKRSVDIGAPGTSILSIVPGGYFSWSGTSMATPHVAGVAALLTSHEPRLTNIEIKNRLMKTSVPVPGLIGKISGQGMVNAHAALTNRVSALHPDDPAGWKSQSASTSSAHPYKNDTKETFFVEVRGAKQISIYFKKLETQNLFDRVTIYDSAGNQVGNHWGSLGDIYSSIIEGSKAKIVLSTDKAQNAYGFDITKIAWR